MAYTNRKTTRSLSESGNNGLSNDLSYLTHEEKLLVSSWGLPHTVVAVRLNIGNFGIEIKTIISTATREKLIFQIINSLFDCRNMVLRASQPFFHGSWSA